MLQTRVLGFPQLIEIDQKRDKKSRQGFTRASAAVEGSKNKQQVLLLTISPKGEGQTCSLYGVKVGMCPGAGQKGDFGVLPIP